MLILIQDRMSINNLEFLHHLFFDLWLVKISTSFRSTAADYVLKFTVIIDLQPTDFKSIYAYVNALDFMHELNSHVFIIKTVLYLVAGHLKKLQVAVNTVVLDINSTFYVWFHLHLNLKYIILMQYFFLSFFLNIFFRLLSNNIYIIRVLHLVLQLCHFDSFLHSNFRWLFGCIFIIIFLNNMDDFLLMHVCYDINSYFWVCRFYLYYVKNISFTWLLYLMLLLWALLGLIRGISFCFFIIRNWNCCFLLI